MRILPAGVPPGLSRLGQRLREAAANTPLFFVGAVIAIAVVFRLGIGAVKPAAAADDVPETRPTPAQVAHVSVPATLASAAAATPVVARAPETASAPKPMVRGKKPRTHGKR